MATQGCSKTAIASDWFKDERVFPFYAALASLLLLLAQIFRTRWRKRKEEVENMLYWLPEHQKVIRRTIQTTCAVISAGEIAVVARLFSQCRDVVHIALLLSLVYAAFLHLFFPINRFICRHLNYHAAFVQVVALLVFGNREVVPIARGESPVNKESESLILFLIVLLVCTGFLGPSFTPRYQFIVSGQEIQKLDPGLSCSPFSSITYGYLSPLIWLAYKKSSLELDDLPAIHPCETANSIKENGLPYLDPLGKSPTKRRSRHLFFGLISYLKKEYLALAGLTCIDIINSFAGPVSTFKILGYLEATDRSGLLKPWVWILWLGGGPILRCLSVQWGTYIKTHLVVRMQALFNQLIFIHVLRTRLSTATPDLDRREGQKAKSVNPEPQAPVAPPVMQDEVTPVEVESVAGALTASSSASSTAAPSRQPEAANANKIAAKQASIQAGSINNLLTVDAENLQEFLELDVPVTVIKIIGCFVLLYAILGWSALVGCGILLITLPLPGYLVKLRTGTNKAQMKRADERLQLVTQTMSVVRMIKLFGWERHMEVKIAQKRNEELQQLMKAEIIDVACHCITQSFPTFAMIGAYSCFVLVMQQPLRASLIFSSITLFDLLRYQLSLISFVLPEVVKAFVSLDRINAFLNSGEIIQQWMTSGEGEVGENIKQQIVIRASEFTWKMHENHGGEGTAGQRKIFKLSVQEEICFQSGRLNLVTGPTGCGKTSLLMSLLGEMVYKPLSSDSFWHLPRGGGIAYAAQESWVLNETIRDNILFRSEYQEDRYKLGVWLRPNFAIVWDLTPCNPVLRQCALERDLELLVAGDLTEVGERGITLSGGQKARITLARAVYSSAEIILLDDILSALDVHTSRWIVDHCLSGNILKGRTVLLVTHNILLASTVADFMVALNSDGTIRTQGPIDKVLKSNKELTLSVDQGLHSEDDAGEKIEQNQAHDNLIQVGKQIVEEEVAVGHVGWPVFKFYLAALGGVKYYICLILMTIALVTTPIIARGFLAFWSAQYDVHPVEEIPVVKYLVIYSVIALGINVIEFWNRIHYFFGIIRASRFIHQALIHSIMRSTLRWLDTTPVSRVLTRCSQDTSAVDEKVSGYLMSVFQAVARIFVNATTAVAMAGWQMLPPAAVTVVAGLVLGHVYMTAQLPVKRLMSNARSPIIGQIQNALVGLVSLRAYGAQDMFQSELRQKIDTYSTFAMPFWDFNRWIAARAETMGGLLSGIIAYWLVYGETRSSSAIGFTIVLLNNFNRQLLTAVRMFNNLEAQANSLERIRDYLMIEHESEPAEEGEPPAYWPASGALQVECLSARYSVNGPEVLKDVSFEIKSGEHIGVVGRTGAGKSTLGLALLRALPTTGRVLFDNRETGKTNLDALRNAISIIPQSPELLEGTLRENLDPSNEHDDAELHAALKATGLVSQRPASDQQGGPRESQEDADPDTIKDQTRGMEALGLDTHVESNGSNFSQGQRQIIALARALVRRSKLLVMDEATSAIDHETDRAIQTFIRSEFDDVTMIVVAHRLQTVMDSDKILVLDSGRLVEFGTPKELLENAGGYFKALVDDSSDKAELYAAMGQPSFFADKLHNPA